MGRAEAWRAGQVCAGSSLGRMTSPATPRQGADLGSRPLVLTLQLDRATQDRFDRERREHFPRGRTAVGAHVTLFHALPGAEEPAIRMTLASTANATDSFTVSVGEPASLGNGVAYPLRSTHLQALHGGLQRLWWPRLSRQDQQGFRPHVTVQNKVAAEVARRTCAELRAAFTPVSCTAVGLDLWRYDGGPWTPLASLPFVPPEQ